MEHTEVSARAVANLNAILKHRDITQAELARLLHKKPQEISRLLKSRQPTGLKLFSDVAKAIGVPVSDLIGRMVPLKGVVSAGPGTDEPEDGECELIPAGEDIPEATVAYTVRGTSMEDYFITEGDRILVRSQPAASDGEIVVVYVPDMGTIVKIKRDHWYESANTRQPQDDIPWVDGCREYGVLVGVIRHVSSKPRIRRRR